MISIRENHNAAENHYNKTMSDIISRIDKIVLRNNIYKVTPAGTNYITLSPNLKRFLLSLRSGNVLRALITLSPKKLEHYANWLNQHRKSFVTNGSDDHAILYNIFVSHAYKKLNKLEFTTGVGVDCCPYCNRNYIYSFSRNKELKPDIDHFYPTSKYPIFAVSYYNLIPACHQCNGFSGKGENDPIDLGLRSPYLVLPNDFKLSYNIKNISIINPLSGKSHIEVYFKNKIQSNCDIFNLEDFYSKHSDHALELILKRKIKYSKNYAKYLRSYKGLTISKTEIDRMVLGNYSLEKEQHKRPLTKLYQDIGSELGIINML